MHLDATAAIGIIERHGLNKVRHIETDVLRLQEREARRILPLTKVLGAGTHCGSYDYEFVGRRATGILNQNEA